VLLNLDERPCEVVVTEPDEVILDFDVIFFLF